LTPEWVDFKNFILILLAATQPYWIYKLIRRIRPQIQNRSARFKWIYYSASLLSQTILSTFLVAVLLANQPSFLFGPKYLRQSKASPDGKQIAYLYSQGFFCGYIIFTRPRHAWVIAQRQTIDIQDCDGKRPRLVWSEDSQRAGVELQGLQQ
jgi:hypothetical protein